MKCILIGATTGAILLSPVGLAGYGAAVGSVLGVLVIQSEHAARRNPSWPTDSFDPPEYHTGLSIITIITVVAGLAALSVGSLIAAAL